MKTQIKADFHIHTNNSDGEGTPEDVITYAKALSLDAIAITDHDDLKSAAWANAYKIKQGKCQINDNLTVIPGIEISARIERSNELDVVHILGYNFDPCNSEMLRICKELKEAREIEKMDRINFACSKGFNLSEDSISRILKTSYWVRGDIAKEQVVQGRFETVDAAYHAIWDFYDNSAICEKNIEADRVIKAIHESCGVALLAHPFRNEITKIELNIIEVVERIDILQSFGLDGIEAFYSAFSLEQCMKLKELAESRNLLTACGSDHHDFQKRKRLGSTCRNGKNYGHLTNLLEAISFKGAL